MEFVKQWLGVNKYMILKPGVFFDNYDERHGVGYPLAFLLVSLLAVVAPLALVGAVVALSDPAGGAIILAAFVGIGLFFWVTSIVEAGIVHLAVYLFGGRGAAKTLEAYAFPALIRFVLWWLPFIGWIPGLYGLYLQIKALSSFHDLSTGKAAVAALAPLVLLVIPMLVIFVAVMAAFVLDLGETGGTTAPPPEAALFLF